jgi:hypothetical protein
MATLYRAMTCDTDGRPKVERTARGLGVRVDGPHCDVRYDEHGRVCPPHGMSVALDDLLGLPDHRLPPSHGGTGRDPLFGLDSAQVEVPLALYAHGHPHHEIAPSRPMDLSKFESGIEATRDHWRLA